MSAPVAIAGDLRRSVLVTGASGFLGAWTIAALLNAGKQVWAFDLNDNRERLDLLLSPQQQAAIRWCCGDISDGAALRGAFTTARPEAVVHLAALQIPACQADPVSGARVNVLGHLQVFEAAREFAVEQLIYTSSIAAKPRGPANAPGNFYGVFKHANEEAARLYWQDYGVSSIGLRPYIVYGAGRDQGETAALTAALRAAARGEAYRLPFAARSCFQYAGEIATVIARCVDAPSSQAALVSDITTTVSTTEGFIAAIRRCVPDCQISVADVMRTSPASGFDNAPLRQLIGDWPSVGLDQGVQETINLFQRLSAINR